MSTSGKHNLAQSWSIWYLKRQQQSTAKGFESYANNISLLGSFDTAEDFWGVYNHIVRPNEVPFPLDFHLFRQGVKPMWEDEENKAGGRFLLRVPRGKKISSRYWEDVVIAVIANQFEVPIDEICGAVISSRHQFDMLSLWIKHADNEEYKAAIEETLKKVMKLPKSFTVEFKPHDETIKDSNNPAPKPAPTQQPRSPQKKRNDNPRNNNRNNANRGEAAEEKEGDATADALEGTLEDDS